MSSSSCPGSKALVERTEALGMLLGICVLVVCYPALTLLMPATVHPGYKALLEQFPGYIDCYLRLACIARTSGSMDDAVDWATKATDMEGGHVDAQSLLAMLYLEQRWVCCVSAGGVLCLLLRGCLCQLTRVRWKHTHATQLCVHLCTSWGRCKSCQLRKVLCQLITVALLTCKVRSISNLL